MRNRIGFLLLAIGIGSFLQISTEAHAAAVVVKICAKNSNGTLKITSGRCPSGYTRIRSLSALKGEAGAIGATGATGATGPQGPSNLVGAAYVGASGILYGQVKGSSTTSITAAHQSAGSYLLTLTGSFAGLTATNTGANQRKVIVNSTASTGVYSVSSAHVSLATSSEIQIQFFTWPSNDTTLMDVLGAYVVVFISE